MAAISVSMQSLLVCQCDSRRLMISTVVVLAMTLMSCASTEELYAQYDEQFCPVDAHALALPASGAEQIAESPVAKPPVPRVIVREVPAAAISTLMWEPAVYYNSDATKLSPSARRSLDTNIVMLKKFPRHRVAIRGFTDEHSSAAYNRKLAQERIAGVKRYLKKRGIASDRVLATSHGESIPLAGDQSAIADNINRRVELLLLDSNGRPLASRQPLVLGPSED